jgi:hypothetical protein
MGMGMGMGYAKRIRKLLLTNKPILLATVQQRTLMLRREKLK